MASLTCSESAARAHGYPVFHLDDQKLYHRASEVMRRTSETIGAAESPSFNARRSWLERQLIVPPHVVRKRASKRHSPPRFGPRQLKQEKIIEHRVGTIIEHITEAYGAEYDLDYVPNYPAIQNNAKLNSLARKSAQTILGEENVSDAPMMTASEDFSYYRKIAPICFLTLGVGDGIANHNPQFNIDEKAFVEGVKGEVQIILNYQNTK